MSTETASSATVNTFTSPEKETVGRTLKRSREERNLSLDEASRATKIKKEFLLAIEDDKLETLPGPVFARGFVRSYAEYLSLDAQAMLARVARTLDGKDAQHEIPGSSSKAPLVSWTVLTAGVGAATALAAFLLTR